MNIAVINETSAADRNAEIIEALEGRGHEIINIGMQRCGAHPELQYTHTGFLAALLLNSKRIDLVVGGCGTGQGFINSAMQYPGVFCGHILTPLDAWLFAQINGGNCISLALNQGYGWASGVNLRFIFDRLFEVEFGSGYPPHRREPQRRSRQDLVEISSITHKPFFEIITALSDEILIPALEYPGVLEFLAPSSLPDSALREALERKVLHYG
jgi:ribose 5-phosphate isomerase RpiB